MNELEGFSNEIHKTPPDTNASLIRLLEECIVEAAGDSNCPRYHQP